MFEKENGRKKEKLILIVGPTAVGKTELSIKIAKEFDGEVFSIDSMQIYRGMDIGTAKIADEEMRGVPHYLLDIINPDEDFSVSDFRERAYKCIKEISSRKKLAIGVGGTGLYVNSLVYDLNFSSSKSSDRIRDKYWKLAEKYGNEYIMDILKSIDIKTAERLNLNDTKRIIRGIEVYELTGKKMSDSYNDFRKENNDFSLTIIGLNRNREKLYERINKRVDIMLEKGLVNEVENLLSQGYSKDLTSMKAIGYKEVIEYIDGKISYDEMVELLKRNSRRFAKRQITWFKRDNRINWFNYDDFENENDLYQKVIKLIKTNLASTEV